MSHMPPFVQPSASFLTSYDALASKLVPASAAEWATLYGSLGIMRGSPTSIHLCQDAASPLHDVNALHDLIAVTGQPGSLTFQNPIAGWTRLAAGIINNSTDTGFSKQHNGLPDPSVYSYANLAYLIFPTAPAADVGFLSQLDGAYYAGIKSSTLRPSIGSSSGQAGVGAYALPQNTVFPAVMHHLNGRKQFRVILPSEIISGGFTVPGANTGEFLLGVAFAAGIRSATANYLYNTLMTGDCAELSVTDIGDLLTAMGWGDIMLWHKTPSPAIGGVVYAPLGLRQWQALDIVAPTHCWANQQTAGIWQANFIGDIDIAVGGAGGGSVSVGQAMPGSGPMSVKTADGVGAQYVGNGTDTRLPDLVSKSVSLLASLYIQSGTATAPFGSWVMGMGLLQVISMAVMNDGKLQTYQNGTTTTGTVDHRGKAFHALLMYDRTAGRTVIFTPYEKIVAGTFYNVVGNGQGVYFGSQSGSVPCANTYYGPCAVFDSSAAEFTDAQARALLQKLGYTVSW